MSIAPTLQRYLTAESMQYDVIPHDPTMSSARTAEACRISGDRLAKAIMLRRTLVIAGLHIDLRLRLDAVVHDEGQRVTVTKGWIKRSLWRHSTQSQRR